MKPEELQGRVRRAVDEFHMIDENDSVAVGLSGGKDSIALLTALSGLSHYYPKHFTVRAVPWIWVLEILIFRLTENTVKN